MYAATTTVPVLKTRMEIDQLLTKHKATQRIVADNDEQHRAIVQFKLHDRVVKFELILPDAAKFYGNRGRLAYEQALRQKWRALLLVLKAKLEAVENKISVFEAEFLAHIVIDRQGHTVGDVLPEQIAAIYANNMAGRLMLGTGDPNAE